MAPNPPFNFSKTNYVCSVPVAFELQHSAVQEVITYISEQPDTVY